MVVSMTQTEALRLALEALEYAGPSWIEARQPAITALKEALAQPEQPKVRTGDCLLVGVCASEGHKIAPQRTWVGLTDEEMQSIAFESADALSAVFVAEAKLRSKNS